MGASERIVAVAGRLPLVGAVRSGRMSGSSIAAPHAAGWITDFLNAAYFVRPGTTRAIDDLRLAFAILTTRWARRDRGRLGARDVIAFHAAFGPGRLRGDGGRRGTLSRARLLAGAVRLLGAWFPVAYDDPARRAHGVVFPTIAEREAYAPERRLRHGALRGLTPPREPAERQHWGTYEPVALPRPKRTLDLLLAPERWPDAGAEGGRFTAVRPGGLEGTTFEIEVSIEPVARAPVFTRAYVTCTALHRRGEEGLRRYVAEVNAALHAQDLPPAVSDDAEPLLAAELTTHEGHFLGRARSRLIAYGGDGGAFLRDVGSWDPLPWHLQQAYERAGARAQRLFWGPERPAASMLVQMAHA